MNADRPIIVSLQEHLAFRHRARFWWCGWAAAIALALVVGYQAGRVSMALEGKRDLERLTREVAKVTEDQLVVNDSFVKAWEGQRSQTALLVSWGEYVKSRDEISTENRKGQPVVELSRRK